MIQILVTGGAGFFGSHLVERLRVDGYAVTVDDNLSTFSCQTFFSNPQINVDRIIKCGMIYKVSGVVPTDHCLFHILNVFSFGFSWPLPPYSFGGGGNAAQVLVNDNLMR